MHSEIGLGIDFGSTGYRAAAAIEGKVLSLPLGSWGESPAWISLNLSTSEKGSHLQFPSIKYCLEKAQPVQTLLGKQTSASLVVQILAEIKILAESYLESKIGQTVIAVPATYSTSRRDTLLAAAKKAGLGQLRLVNDAMTLSMDFTLQHPKDSILLIYSAGYSQCEVAIIRHTKRQFRALAYGNSDKPCGRILDDAILTGAIRALQEIGFSENLQNFSALEWLQQQQIVQKVKEQLENRVNVHLPIHFESIKESFYLPVYYSAFSSLVEQMMQDNGNLIDETLREAKLRPQDISQVLIAGGTTRLEVIPHFLEKYFVNCPLKLMTDDAIARGAAAFASNLIDVQAIDYSPVKSKGDIPKTSDIGTSFLALEVKKTSTLAQKLDQELLDVSNISRPINNHILGDRLPDVQPNLSPLWDYARTVDLTTAQKFLTIIKNEAEQQLQALAQPTARRNWRIEKAIKLLEQGKYENAVQQSHLALASNPDNYKILEDMIDIHKQAAQKAESIEDAIRWLSCALTHDQSNMEVSGLIADCHFLQAQQLYQSGETASALQSVKACLEVNRSHAEALKLKGMLIEKLQSQKQTLVE